MITGHGGRTQERVLYPPPMQSQGAAQTKVKGAPVDTGLPRSGLVCTQLNRARAVGINQRISAGLQTGPPSMVLSPRHTEESMLSLPLCTCSRKELRKRRSRGPRRTRAGPGPNSCAHS